MVSFERANWVIDSDHYHCRFVNFWREKEQLYCLNSPALTIGDHFLQERGTFMSQGERSKFLWRFPKCLDPTGPKLPLYQEMQSC
mgnify:CR=1 FL=1